MLSGLYYTSRVTAYTKRNEAFGITQQLKTKIDESFMIRVVVVVHVLDKYSR